MKNSPEIYPELFIDLIAEIWKVYELGFHLPALLVQDHAEREQTGLYLPFGTGDVLCHPDPRHIPDTGLCHTPDTGFSNSK